MTWTEALRTEIVDMFAILMVPFDIRTFYDDRSDWTWMHRGSAKDVGIRTRRVGRDPEKSEIHRVATRESMRRLRRRRNKQKQDKDRWASLRSAPLIPVEIDGVIWMHPPKELERRRETARNYQRSIRGRSRAN